MQIKTLAFAAIMFLVGCDAGVATVAPYKSVQAGIDQEPGLSDCKAYSVNREMVIRCPLSTTSTTTHHGSGGNRHTNTSVVIDGVTYKPAAVK
jgi:hypothetical protein